MHTTIEADLLQTFVVIAESGSFTEAGRRVGRTQSAVSMQIKRLEDLLGRPVFTRDGRPVTLTHDGEILLGHTRRILRAHREALAEFSQPDLHGTVTLGTTDEYAVAFLPAILSRFAEGQCRVHVDVVCDSSINLLARMADNAVDLAVVTHGYGDDGGTVLKREPVVWATSARHAVHQEDPVPLALFHPGCRFRQWVIDALSSQGRSYRLAYTSVSLTAIEAAVRAGLAVTALPLSNVHDGLRILDERDGFPELPYNQIELRRSEQAQSLVHDCLAQHIIDNFRPGPSLTAAA